MCRENLVYILAILRIDHLKIFGGVDTGVNIWPSGNTG